MGQEVNGASLRTVPESVGYQAFKIEDGVGKVNDTFQHDIC
jgi:hypothetical protein